MKRNEDTICLSVMGPTCSGKTARVMAIAEQLMIMKRVAGVDMISADSRQVYKGLEILTGADVPEGFEADSLRQPFDKLRVTSQCDSLKPQIDFPHFTNIDGSIRIFGISIIDPADEWSLAHFVNFAREIMLWSWSNNRQPILVGGTGLYHKHLFSDDETPQISQDLAMREKAQKMSVEELQQWLDQVDSSKLQQMNESDCENPRRLIRAIEVSIWQKKYRDSLLGESKLRESSILWSQVENQVELLSAPLEIIKDRIEQRVHKRFVNGAVQEVQNLLDLHLPASAPVLTTLGAPEVAQYLDGTLSAEACQQLWSLHEFQYAKRQLTWWKNTNKPLVNY